MHPDKLYDPRFVQQLFDEMAQTYGLVNLVSSFGFARRWRRQCVQSVDVTSGATALDLMTGMGELCPNIVPLLGQSGTVLGLDISPVMCERARRNAQRIKASQIQIVEANVFDCPIADGSVDYVFSTFGLKTFNPDQLHQLALEVKRVLRPGGQFAFLEISVPPSRLLRWPYLAYINHIIPLIGRLFLGNPENYRLLGVYTAAFHDCKQAAESFVGAQLQVTRQSYFFGCATGFTGHKPISDAG